jgi:hypothetical protein
MRPNKALQPTAPPRCDFMSISARVPKLAAGAVAELVAR